jgi:hypothetical protein
MQVATIASPPWNYSFPAKVTVDGQEVHVEDYKHWVIDQILEEFNRARGGERLGLNESVEATFEVISNVDVRFFSASGSHSVEKLIIAAQIIGFEERLAARRATLEHIGVTTVRGTGRLSQASIVVTQVSGKEDIVARVYWNDGD